MKILFDAEGDGLFPTRLWCFSLIDIDTREITEYGPKDIEAGLKHLQKADVLIGHNIIGYDLPHIKRLYGVDFEGTKIIDTLVLSRLNNPIQEGLHSLQTWGVKMGFPKVEHECWSQYTKGMQNRCTMDVRLNLKVYLYLIKNMQPFSQDCIDLEHEVAYIMRDQQIYGWLFDIRGAEQLLAKVQDELGTIEDRVHETFKPKQLVDKVVTPKIKKDGNLSRSGLRPEEFEAVELSGNRSPFNRYYTQVFNLSSRSQIALWLQDFGWKPTVFTENSKAEHKKDKSKSLKPKMDETVLEGIKGIPEADLINDFLGVSKIRGFLENWLDSVEEDGRQHGHVNPMGAVTGRMSHSKPNLAQVPSKRKKFGMECRDLFTVPEGYTLLGMDAQGLELRMLAHYMDKPSYTLTASTGDSKLGTDAHTVNMKAAGLTDRDQAKTMYYALIYGAGDKKMGSIVGGGIQDGKLIKSNLFGELPELEDLIYRAQAAAQRGYIRGIDGRLIRIRAVYSALNTLLQGGGAVIMKRALVILKSKADKAGLDYHFVGNVHDEIQSEVADEHVEAFKLLALEAMVEAGEYYDMKCPMEGSVGIGSSWAETH